MTIENDIDLLVSDVTTRNAAVVKAKGDLDAIVAEGASSEGQAESAALAALSARDEASAMATTSGALATASVGATAFADLAAIAASKVESAVDVFIYDTSLDSDGGAWRYRTQGTSWYRETLNTATRGSRREFPAVAVMVAVAGDAVTIYDGDDPALPMWMAFPRGSTTHWFDSAQDVTSTSALNGVVCVGSKYDEENRGGLRVFNFVADTGYHFAGTYQAYNGFYKGGIAQRGETGRTFDGSGSMIADRRVNDVAMTVLPDAPIDPATGLPMPTVAVATSGGISLIRNDGTVQNKDIGGPDTVFQLSMSGTKIITRGGTSTSFWGNMAWDVQTDTLTLLGSRSVGLSLGGDVSGPTNQIMLIDETNLVGRHHDGYYGQANIQGLGLIDWSNTARTLSYARTSTWVSGWQTQNMRSAWLADTDDADLVEIVGIGNGTFDTGLSGWAYDAAAWSWDASGRAYHNYDEALGAKALITDFPGGEPSVGDQFYFSFDYEVLAGSLCVGDDYSPISSGLRFLSGSGTASGIIRIRDGRQNRFAVWPDNVNQLVQAYVDNVVVRKVGSLDRSVNNKGLIVNGRVRRAPVTDGAELVAYSGFSAKNYLEQPYNADLDFGTGDFAVMGWFWQSASALATIVDRYAFGRSGAGFEVRLDTNGRLFVFTSNATGQASYVYGASGSFSFGSHSFFAVVRRSGALELYVNGVRVAEQASVTPTIARDISVSAPVRIGSRVDGALPFNGDLSLLRITGTPPSADQIGRIYNDERALFEPGAACTLYGASDAVTALAHDRVTNLLHVGTSAGRSLFDGLRRVAHTTAPVGNTIAARNGLIIED